MGTYFDSEVPKEIIKGQKYTARQLLLYILNNNAELLSTEIQLNNESMMMTIEDIKEVYIHRAENNKYKSPNDKTMIITAR